MKFNTRKTSDFINALPTLETDFKKKDDRNTSINYLLLLTHSTHDATHVFLVLLKRAIKY